MAFVRVYGRATPDRAGARPYHGGQTLYLMLTQMGGRRTETTSSCSLWQGRTKGWKQPRFVKRLNSRFSNEK